MLDELTEALRSEIAGEMKRRNLRLHDVRQAQRLERCASGPFQRVLEASAPAVTEAVQRALAPAKAALDGCNKVEMWNELVRLTNLRRGVGLAGSGRA